MIVPKGLEDVLRIDSEIMHGVPCFAGTRIPLTAFLDNLTEGMGLEEFLTIYPTIERKHAQAVLEWEHSAIRKAVGLQLAG